MDYITADTFPQAAVREMIAKVIQTLHIIIFHYMHQCTNTRLSEL